MTNSLEKPMSNLEETAKITTATVEAGNGLLIYWDGKPGFGRLSIKVKDGKLKLDTEFMGKDFAKAVMSKLIDAAEVEYDETQDVAGKVATEVDP